MCNQKSNLINRAEAPRTVFFHGVDGARSVAVNDEKTSASIDEQSANRWNAEAQNVTVEKSKSAYAKNQGLTGRVFCK